jgi:ribulose-phosphate 3-epimerase
MFEVIPSVNEISWDLVKKRVESIAGVTDWIELDIGDGLLTPTKTWDNPADLTSLLLSKPVKFAAHLMVKNPGQFIDAWIKAGVRRIIVQYEGIAIDGLRGLFSKRQTTKTIQALSQKCKENWVEFGLSIGLNLQPKQIQRFFPGCDIVQILAGIAGPASQEFSQVLLSKMSKLVELRQAGNFSFKTEWDIGVNPDTIESIKKSGADIAASTSFVFNSADPVLALEYLKKKASGLI